MCSGRGLRERLGAVNRCILSLAVGDLMSSALFALPLTPLLIAGACVDAMALASPLVRPPVVPFVRGTAEGIMINDTVNTE